MEERDVVIVGGGPAGYVAAIRVSQLGGKATLIENNTIGGTCLNRGCIPTRALVRGVEFIDLAKSAGDYGVSYLKSEIDFSKMMARKDTIVRTIVAGVKLLLEGNGVEVINGTGKLLSPSQLEVKLSDGTKKEITARRIIIATGSRGKKVSVPRGEGEKVINTTEALELKEIPKSMRIIGGGFIGIAFATIFSKLGTSVTIVEPSPPILAEIDREIVSILEKELKKAKIQVYTQAQANLTAEYILTTEREANANGLGLDKAGVELSDKGGITVNKRMETGVPNILAAGDVTMEHMWTHVAFAEGIVAAENAMGKSSEIDYTVIPYWASTFPEISAVGITEEEATSRGYQVRVGRFLFAGNGMATILGQRTGMIKVITEEKYGQILGVHIIGPQASNLIQEAALAMKLDATPEDISLTMHGHPTLSEALWEAAKDVSGETIHFISQNR
ncbi:MAG: dihydrolipoyl dehydrogenase [Dehalococcoidia bacterium]|nr:dihydrolipoyl dehydrogenase [Dehalococcoidia bacterium]